MASKKAKTLEQLKTLAREITMFDSYDEYEESDIFAVLTGADDLYNNGQESFLTDEQYDSLRRYAEQAYGENEYFGDVGSEVRGGKIKLPHPMGSLTQAYEGDIAKYISQYSLAKEDIVVTEKLDGISALLVYGDDGKLRIAYSRGDGIEGADITRHVSRIRNVPKKVTGPMAIRSEIIFSKADWYVVNKKIKRSGGQFYKNARNATAGLMNASVSDPIAYDHLSVVAYEIVSPKQTVNKESCLHNLEKLGFTTPMTLIQKGSALNDSTLANLVNKWRADSKFEIDGIVLEVSNAHLRANMNSSRDTLNPEYARKYKIADASNLAVAEVINVEWNASKHGYLKPRVNIKPVELVGVTVQFATGFNARFIRDNQIGPGAKIRITRSGDVIPFIIGVVEPTTPQMPSGDWKWNDTDVDAVLSNPADNEEVLIQQILDFFRSIDAPNLKEGSVREMQARFHFVTPIQALSNMIRADRSTWVSVIGSNGNKIYDGIREKLSAITLYHFMGSTTFFGRGVGVRKFKKLLTALKIKDVPSLWNLKIADIVAVEGFDEKTAKKIIGGMQSFIEFYATVTDYVTFVEDEVVVGGDLQGQSFIFTEFRSKELEAAILSKGGTMSSTVSKKTTYVVAADPAGNSGKIKKAREIGVKIIGEAELREILGE